MRNNEAIIKLKIGTIVAWTVIYLCYAVWGNKYPESAGLATDTRGYLYASSIDTYRDEVRLQKRNPRGRVIWSRTYQGKHISHGENENVVITSSGLVYQIIGKLWDNSAYLTVLCYDSDGRRRWIKDLYGIPYFKEKVLDGDDLLISGLDKNGGSFKIIRLTPDGTLGEPVFLYNPFNHPHVQYRILPDALEVAARQGAGIKLFRLDYDGKTSVSWDLPEKRFLNVNPDLTMYLAAQPQKGGIDKYSPSGQLVWTAQITTALPPALKQVIQPEHLEWDQTGNLYVAGSDQRFTARYNWWTAFYNKGTHYRMDDGIFYRTRGGDRVFLAKINPLGQTLWVRSFITCQANPRPRGLAVDQRGNVYLSGNFNFLNSRDNCFIAKYSDRGKLLWVKYDLTLPASLFYILLAATLLGISWVKKDRFWKAELVILLILMVGFWGLAVF